MDLHENNLSAASALLRLAAIVERDELTPAMAAECVRAVWEFERYVYGCELPGELLVIVADLEHTDLAPSALAAALTHITLMAISRSARSLSD